LSFFYEYSLLQTFFLQSIPRVIEEDGILSAEHGDCKLPAVFTVGQTVIYIDLAGKTTVYFTGNATIDIMQGILLLYSLFYGILLILFHFWCYRSDMGLELRCFLQHQRCPVNCLRSSCSLVFQENPYHSRFGNRHLVHLEQSMPFETKPFATRR